MFNFAKKNSQTSLNESNKIPPELFKKIRKIEFSTRKMVNEMLSGRYSSLFRGFGMEFEDVREYFAGDDYRRIDWNVTARHDKPYVKRFHEERQLSVTLLIDISGSLEFGSSVITKGEKIAEMSALLAFTALSNHDKIGTILFTDKVEKYIPPNSKRNTVLRMIRDILYHKRSRKKTDLNLGLEYAIDNMKRRGIIFIFSDFFCDIDKKKLTIAARKHDLIPVIVSDEFEYAQPGVGIIEAIDNETGRKQLIDTESNVYRAFIEQRKSTVADKIQIFKKIGIEPIILDCNDDIEKIIIEYFYRRSKKR